MSDAAGHPRHPQAAGELTRQWRELTGEPLVAVSGNGSLALATAFYSPDHPSNAGPFEFEDSWGLPRKPSLDHGWAALCFRDQETCIR